MSSDEQGFHPSLGELPIIQPQVAFFVGIGGVGMAGLAALLHDLGYTVSGSDASHSEFVSGLASRGIAVHQGHDATKLPEGCSLVVRTPAVKDDNPVLIKAKALGIPVFSRGHMLAALFNSRQGVAVAGTHGKTTTSAMIVHMLQAIEYGAGYFVGGLSGGLEETSKLGTEDLFITEADESDGTLAYYQSTWGLLTNIEYDHAETFKDEDELLACFQQFVQQSENVIYNMDDEGCRKIVDLQRPSTSYGLTTEADFSAQNLVLERGCVRFDFIGAADPIPVLLNVDGVHNALDALAALSFVARLGLNVAKATEALATFKPVNRRFEMLLEAPRYVISDYAHHPTEIRMAVQSALRLEGRKCWVIFQPHRYSRTLALKEQFPASFAGVDELVLCPVYAASERPLEGGLHCDLYEAFEAEEGFVVSLADSLNEAWEYVRSKWMDGDVLLIAGAGDVEQIASWAVADIENQGTTE